MTREEIINEIKPILDELSYPDAVSYLTQNDVKWLNEIIKTLEKESNPIAIIKIKYDEDKLKELANKAVFTTVIPQSRKGHWIECNDDTCDWYECSECGYGSEGEMQYNREYDVRTNYCPNCGIKMR